MIKRRRKEGASRPCSGLSFVVCLMLLPYCGLPRCALWLELMLSKQPLSDDGLLRFLCIPRLARLYGLGRQEIRHMKLSRLVRLG